MELTFGFISLFSDSLPPPQSQPPHIQTYTNPRKPIGNIAFRCQIPAWTSSCTFYVRLWKKKSNYELNEGYSGLTSI